MAKKLAPTGCKCKVKVESARQAEEGIEPAVFIDRGGENMIWLKWEEAKT